MPSSQQSIKVKLHNWLVGFLLCPGDGRQLISRNLGYRSFLSLEKTQSAMGCEGPMMCISWVSFVNILLWRPFHFLPIFEAVIAPASSLFVGLDTLSEVRDKCFWLLMIKLTCFWKYDYHRIVWSWYTMR